MAGSAVASGVVHAVVVLLCGLWLLPLPTKPAHVAIETVWSEGELPDALDPVPLPVVADLPEPGGSTDAEAVFQHTQNDDRPDIAIDVSDVAAFDLLDATDPEPVALTEMLAPAGGAGGGRLPRQGSGEGRGHSVGDGDGSSQFFGRKVEGRRVVYVVDASRSMNHPHPGPMLTRFGRVKLELIRSIRQMTPEQEFFIVYFNDLALPMPSNTMLRASPSVQDKFLRWAAGVPAGGSTNPEQALALALTLRPDVIYFLTDGDFPEKIVKQVAQANRGGVVIHTIGFADDEGEDRLRKIALQNLGNYQFIPPDDDGS